MNNTRFIAKHEKEFIPETITNFHECYTFGEAKRIIRRVARKHNFYDPHTIKGLNFIYKLCFSDIYLSD